MLNLFQFKVSNLKLSTSSYSYPHNMSIHPVNSLLTLISKSSINNLIVAGIIISANHKSPMPNHKKIPSIYCIQCLYKYS